MKTVDRSLSLTDQAVESIRASIMGGDLIPGQLYTATDLGQKIGVSRTPVREALLELARRGLVEIVPKRGARILNTSGQALMEIFQVRLMLEVPLARRAAELKDSEATARVEAAYADFRLAAEEGDASKVLRADRDFHRALLAGAHNAKANQLLGEQRDFVLSTGVGTVPTSRTPMECFDDHADIMEAYRAELPAAVGEAMARHIAHTAEMLMHQEARKRPEFTQVDVVEGVRWLIDFHGRAAPSQQWRRDLNHK